MTSGEKVMYAIAVLVVLAVLVTVLDVACMMGLDMRLAEVPKRAATPVPTPTPRPSPSATPLLPTPTPEPVTATPTLAALTPTPTLSAESAKVVVDAGCSQFDAPGDDNYNKENEWVCFANVGGQPADMTDWVLRDEQGWRYTFPAFSLGPGQTVRVHTGCGANSAMDVYWCKGGATAVWNNEGDTVFLLDAAGNLVAQYSYPGS